MTTVGRPRARVGHNDAPARRWPVKYGARNRIVGEVTTVKKGDVMSLVKFRVRGPC